jgi:hypothetical protein
MKKILIKLNKIINSFGKIAIIGIACYMAADLIYTLSTQLFIPIFTHSYNKNAELARRCGCLITDIHGNQIKGEAAMQVLGKEFKKEYQQTMHNNNSHIYNYDSEQEISAQEWQSGNCPSLKPSGSAGAASYSYFRTSLECRQVRQVADDAFWVVGRTGKCKTDGNGLGGQ